MLNQLDHQRLLKTVANNLEYTKFNVIHDIKVSKENNVPS